MKQTLLSFVFAISTFTFGQYEKGNTVVVWTKLKYKESLEGVEGVSQTIGENLLMKSTRKQTKPIIS
jgi:hypothetical protein